ncbi:TPA: hypothetical protein SAY52_005447 [Burkholderia cenocepacia]|uniref:hypothetical protein n=1 Tax=unclassified Burkholderia TaxID=2613784 RepID=UPI00158B6820|nr:MULTISPECIES: hypothetical protein [unclassified Burkholderia]HEF5874768.1 hypothetical protein [Burkholderia cenocepacia]
MASIYVQYSDSTENKIVGYFGSPQDEATFPNQGTVDASDARWVAFYATIPTVDQPNFPAPESKPTSV